VESQPPKLDSARAHQLNLARACTNNAAVLDHACRLSGHNEEIEVVPLKECIAALVGLK